MADHLSATYGVRDVRVWHNCFPLSERAGISPPTDRPIPSVVEAAWVSTTVGPGRGLEDGLAAISRLAPRLILHVYGDIAPATERWATRFLTPLIERRAVVMHPPIPAERIIATLARHQIGLSLDGDDCLNRSLTVANKFFYYLQAGLACVAAATPGHRSVVPPDASYGTLYPPGDVAALVSTLERLLVPDALLATQRAAWDAGSHPYAWDLYRPQVLAAVSQATAAASPAELRMEPAHA
jgi:glycosyltransferase involved in cell wall biosynthesis